MFFDLEELECILDDDATISLLCEYVRSKIAYMSHIVKHYPIWAPARECRIHKGCSSSNQLGGEKFRVHVMKSRRDSVLRVM